MPYDYPALLFHNAEAGTAMMTVGLALDDPEWLKAFLITNARQLGMAGKLLFPVPERGLSQRLYRIKAKTLLIWGDSDKPSRRLRAWRSRRGSRARSWSRSRKRVTW